MEVERILAFSLEEDHDRMKLIEDCLLNCYQTILPSADVTRARTDLAKRVKDFIECQYEGCEILLYGSCASGVELESSDLDFTVVMEEAKEELLYEIAHRLTSIGFNMRTNVNKKRAQIAGIHSPTGIRMDMTLNDTIPMLNAKFIKVSISIDPVVKQLLLLVKHWSRVHKVNSSGQGTLANFGFNLMSIYFLQMNNVLPQLNQDQLRSLIKMEQEEELVSYEDSLKKKSPPHMRLGLLFYEFFRFYAYRHNFELVISVRQGRAVSFESLGWTKPEMHHLRIEHPFNSEENVGRAVHKEGKAQILDIVRRTEEILRGEDKVDVIFELVDVERKRKRKRKRVSGCRVIT